MKESGMLKRFVNGKSTSPLEKMLLCAAASLSGSFYRYEGYLPRADLIRLAVFFLMAMTWICCAVTSGKDRKGFYPIFTCIYWIVPYIFSFYYAARDNVRHYSKPLSFLNRIAKDIVFAPFTQAVRETGIGVNTMLTVFLFIVIAFYMFGFFLNIRCEKAYAPQIFKTAEKNDNAESEMIFSNDISDTGITGEINDNDKK